MRETTVLSARDADAESMRRYGLDAGALEGCTAREYGFGERVLSEGERIRHILLVTGGKAKVGLMAPNGRSLILCFYLSRGLLGDVELFSGRVLASATVTALDGFRCLAIPLEPNRARLLNNLAFAQTAAAELSEKLMRSSISNVSHTLYTADVRLCRYLCEASDGACFRDVMTDVACSIGVSYRHLYRMMNALCEACILEKTPAGYRILDLDALTRRAQLATDA